MADMFDINNLELDDNSFEIIPDGDYHFTVESHEVDYSTSEKMPPNTQVIICHLEIPFISADGELKTAKIKNNLNVYKKGLWAIRQFSESIGLCPEKGKFVFNVDAIDGKTGVCAVTTRTSNNGNEYNNVQLFYAPSKAPAVTANDEAWNRQAGFSAADGEDPFADI
jgi:hypothetical protein